MKNKLIIIILLVVMVSMQSHLSMFYCGFGGDFCGQSTLDDVHGSADIIILAFANTNPDGSIIVDDQYYPAANVQKWKKASKKVVLSVGGQNGNWNYVFASQTSINNFINSVVAQISNYKLDGIDLDIQSYNAPPRKVVNMIKQLRTQFNNLGKKLIIVSPQCIAVYQGVGVPDPDVGGNPFNYFVNIIKLADDSIDYYQVQAYNNWYDGLAGGSLDYIRDVYLNWRNLQGLSPWAGPIPNFSGVDGNKLLIGVMASTQAGGAAYYAPPKVIADFKSYLATNNYNLYGFMVWDSHWDTLNNFAISNAITQ